jgi:hypothetical protein
MECNQIHIKGKGTIVYDHAHSRLISNAQRMISIRSSAGSLSKGKGVFVVKTLFPILRETLELVPCTALVIPRAVVVRFLDG